MAEPARCGSDEDAVGGDLRMGEGLVDDVDVEEYLKMECFGLGLVIWDFWSTVGITTMNLFLPCALSSDNGRIVAEDTHLALYELTFPRQ